MILHYLTIAEAAELIGKRQLSPVELTRACLERIECLDGRLHSYITLTGDLALKEARIAESEIISGHYRGPLHGIPVALKDLYATKGIRTTAHSQVLLEWIPDEDATTVSRLKQAGTILLGKLSMHEFATGGARPNKAFPMARNPWNLAHVPGDSSSGSGAALAAGLCMGSLGSDTGGSIRYPASACGIVGLKPTYGRVSRSGVIPMSWSLDHCGPMTRTVRDNALMLQAIAGHDPKDPSSSKAPVPDYVSYLDNGVQGLVLGIARQQFFQTDSVDPETLAAVEKAIQALEELGAKIKVVDIPCVEYVNEALNCIMASEAFAYHEANMQSQPHNYGPSVQRNVRWGAFYSAADYIQAQRVRTQFKTEFQQVMSEVDALTTPTMVDFAEPFEEYDTRPLAPLRSNCTRPFNLSGQPAISICCGFTAAGLPVGLQIAGRSFDETTVLRIANAYERSAPWHQMRPPI